MTHREKVDYFLADMRRRQVAASNAAPPAYRLLWRLGAEVRPPHFQGFFALALQMGVPFGVVFTAAMYVIRWRAGGMPLWLAGVMALASGALFGLAMAGYFRVSARKLNLPPWEDYPAAEPDEWDDEDR